MKKLLEMLKSAKTFFTKPAENVALTETKNISKISEVTTESETIIKHNELQKMYEELLNKPQANYNPKTGCSYLYQPEVDCTTVRVIKGKVDDPNLSRGVRYSGVTPISENVNIVSRQKEDGTYMTYGKVRTTPVKGLYDSRFPCSSPWLNSSNSRRV